jgi:hypothetical protein
VEAETLAGQQKHIQYKGDSKNPAAFKITQNGREDKPLAEGKPTQIIAFKSISARAICASTPNKNCQMVKRKT